MSQRIYKFGESQLILTFGDLTTSKAQVLVSSDDYYLTMGGGVSAAIRKAGGNSIQLDTLKMAPAALGDVVVTGAGSLPAQYIFHAITIGPGASSVSLLKVVELITQRCLQLLDALELRSIAFPAIGTGIAGFRYEDVAVQMANVIAENLKNRKKPIEVSIYLFHRSDYSTPLDFVRFFEEFAVRVPQVASHETKSKSPSNQAILTTPKMVSTKVEDPRLHHHQLLKQIAALGQERDELEGRLVQLESLEQDHEITEVRRRISEIQEQRLQYLRERQALAKQGVEVFISYAHKDEELRKELAKHFRGLVREGVITDWHDRMIAAGDEWRGQIDTHLNSARVILLLVSADFMASDYCYDVEMTRALERHEAGEARVIPVILRAVYWKEAPFAKLQALPMDGKPVTSWADRDEAFVSITEGIRAAINHNIADDNNYV